MNEGGAGRLLESRLHEIRQKMEGVFASKLTGPGDSEYSFRESFTCFGLIAEAQLSPLHSRSESPLCGIVGRFDALVGQEGEKTMPIAEQPLRPGAHQLVGALRVLEAIVFHPSPHEEGRVEQLVPVDDAAFEGMPTSEYLPDLVQHVL